MERRTFLGLFSVGMIASSLPIVLAACTPQEEKDEKTEATNEQDNKNAEVAENNANKTASQGGKFTSVGTIKDLDTQGAIAATVGEIPVIVFRNAEKKLVAFDSRCTHRQCPVNLSNGELICPCHGSKFALDGTVTKGPASTPLPALEVKEEKATISVKI